ncbi:hypothetical protein [Amycolatopsis sp. CA-230715]|uniref:hypothetical protein n=1 Tax=Amycolatopsis sp. CA-230715 TaxID=2745196 RepID=UPI001C020B6E|nr:hypothetical protein [Amycolatopsis sp. CA-230715]QWF86054.1 hypothetical protein HUW46_09535 [Amycolatopsis sp. CA-230715]
MSGTSVVRTGWIGAERCSGIVPAEGQRLYALPEQDSYSYELANLFIRAGSEREMIEKYENCVAALRFEFDER